MSKSQRDPVGLSLSLSLSVTHSLSLTLSLTLSPPLSLSLRLANVCGLHIIVHPDHLEELIGHYERAGKSAELMQLLEQGLGLDNAHSGIFSDLAVLYSKYTPEKLMEHIKVREREKEGEFLLLSSSTLTLPLILTCNTNPNFINPLTRCSGVV
jgi:hypothetical protein